MKKTLSLLSVLVLCFSAALPVTVKADPKATVYANCSSWAYGTLEAATASGLLPDVFTDADMTEPITRAEFAAVAVALWEALSDEKAAPAAAGTFIDTSDPEVLKACNLGLTSGISANEFGPDIVLNREQMAAMLSRVYKKVYISGWTLSNDGNYGISTSGGATFADHGQISAWAVDSVYFMYQVGAISGMGDNNFGPQNTATREQAVVVATKSYIDAGESITQAIAGKYGSAGQPGEPAGLQGNGGLGNLSAAYLDILGSGSYYMKYRMEIAMEGEKVTGTFEIAVRGSDFAQITDMMGMKSIMIMMGGKMYIVDHDSQMVMVMSAGMMGSSGTQTSVPDSGFVFMGSGTATLFGVSRVYEEYATDTGNVRYFFDGDKLVGMEMTSEGAVVQMEILELSTNIPEDMFDIPSDYMKIEM